MGRMVKKMINWKESHFNTSSEVRLYSHSRFDFKALKTVYRKLYRFGLIVQAISSFFKTFLQVSVLLACTNPRILIAVHVPLELTMTSKDKHSARLSVPRVLPRYREQVPLLNAEVSCFSCTYKHLIRMRQE